MQRDTAMRKLNLLLVVYLSIACLSCTAVNQKQNRVQPHSIHFYTQNQPASSKNAYKKNSQFSLRDLIKQITA